MMGSSNAIEIPYTDPLSSLSLWFGLGFLTTERPDRNWTSSWNMGQLKTPSTGSGPGPTGTA